MELQIRKEGALVVCALEGQLDAEGALELRQALEQQLLEAKSLSADSSALRLIAVDLVQISFIDSSGIGALVWAFKRLKEANLRMAVINVAGQPDDMMRFLRVDKVLQIYPDVETLVAKERL